MVNVFPFRGIHFSPAKVGRDLTKLTAQPYDRIDAALQDNYYRRHEFNIIRVTKNKDESTDTETRNKYTRARETMQAWLDQGVLDQDKKPTFYAYFQTYRTPKGTRTRKGLAAMVRTEEFGKGKIYPHEETHIGPKIDRLKLLHESKTHFESIFLLYSDPEKAINQILDEASKAESLIEAKDDYGELHQIWPITDPKTCKKIQSFFEDRSAIIADGHHRYETALKYSLDMRKMGVRCEGAESTDNVLATLVNIDDTDGLTVFGTHRAIQDAPGFDLKKLKKDFDVKEGTLDELAKSKKISFGLTIHGDKKLYLVTLKDEEKAVQRNKEHSRDWNLLDVNVLHTMILNDVLGITPEDLAHEKKIDYHRDAKDVIKRVQDGQYALAFLVNPVKIGQIKDITKKWERFPQKTTDFYPKLLSGLLMCRLNIVEPAKEKARK